MFWLLFGIVAACGATGFLVVTRGRRPLALIDEGSEDARHLLGDPPERESLAVGADERVQWTMQLRLAEPQSVADVARAWGRSTAGALPGARLYAQSENGEWRSVEDPISSGTTMALCAARSLRSVRDDEGTALVDFEESVRQWAPAMSVEHIAVNASVEDGVKRARRLLDLVLQWDMTVDLVLTAPARAPFDGRDVWDVMMSLGFEWATSDHFQWSTKRTDLPLLSVWSEPGEDSFDRDSIAAGDCRVQQLHFGYSVPFSPQPVRLMDVVLKVAEYAQGRLGGELRSGDGVALNLDRKRKAVEVTVKSLEQAGFPPGAHATLEAFSNRN